jgi:hypothetical protein
MADELQLLNAEKDQANASRTATEEVLKATGTKLRNEQTVRNAMEQSLSWRVTAPIRNIMMKLRSGPRREA